MNPPMKETFTTSVPLSQVTVTDPFWGGYMELARTRIIPYQWEALNDRIPDAEPSHCIHNFRVAAGLEEGKFEGCVFQDSDLAKWLEGAAYSLTTHPDKELEATIDSVVELMEKAQQPDGYLDTYYILNGLDKRWTNVRDNHEMYCAGHMLEAAVAYYQATGKDRMLNIMIRVVEYISSVFGPEEGKKKGYPGHEELELALVRLYQVTGDPKHLALAKYFIDQRGQKPLFFEEEAKVNGPAWEGPLGLKYYQAAQPVRDQQDADGHAVRAVYLYSGMASVAKETRNEELAAACRRLWESITRRRMYITGAIGSSEYGEAFTYDYDLPNDLIYGETCAAIGLAMFARRMLELSPKGEYADVMERALYNGVISGLSLEGDRFFYVNPLEVVPEACEKDQRLRHVKYERQKWFGCACCPPNLARVTSSIGWYVYTQREDALFVNLYAASQCHVTLGGVPATVSVEGNYPWEGTITLKISAPSSFTSTLALRIPGWCRNWKLSRNGEAVEPSIKDGYAMLDGSWNDGDTLVLELDMPVERIQANPLVREDIGKQAVMRGPIVYCLEEIDNGKKLYEITLPREADFTAKWEKDLLGGVVTVESRGLRTVKSEEETGLYRFAAPIKREEVSLRWVPYYAWNNRGVGEMTVWVHSEEL